MEFDPGDVDAKQNVIKVHVKVCCALTFLLCSFEILLYFKSTAQSAGRSVHPTVELQPKGYLTCVTAPVHPHAADHVVYKALLKSSILHLRLPSGQHDLDGSFT